MQTRDKQSNIELLRIVAMFMIVVHHFCVHGIFKHWHSNANLLEHINNFIVFLFSMGGKVGVDIFVLITGYFAINTKWKFSHALRIYLTAFFYSIIFLLAAIIYNNHEVPKSHIITSLMPIGKNAYWFVSTYLLLYLLIPYLNKFIKSAKEKMLNTLLIILSLLWVIMPTFVRGVDYGTSLLTWFIYLYFIGASLRTKKFGKIFSNMKIIRILALASISYWIIYALSKTADVDFKWQFAFRRATVNTLYTLSISIYLFKVFESLKLKTNKLINYISSSTFGVYLFHENIFVRPFLWVRLFHVSSYMTSPYLFLFMLFCTFAVFMCGVILDKIFFKIAGKAINKICYYVKFIYKKYLMQMMSNKKAVKSKL